MELNPQFLNQFRNYYGKPFEIVSGRNAYTFDKNNHARMLAQDGIYLLLENPPQDNLKYKYDKALLIAARTVDKFFPTNDPSKVKDSFHLGADKMRFEFHQQMHKLYQTQSCILKTVKFDNTRRDYRIERKDYEYLIKNDGVFVFIYVVGNKPNLIMEVATLAAKSIVGFVIPKGEKKSSLTLHFELSVYTLKMLDDLKLRTLLTKEPKPKVPEPVVEVQPDVYAQPIEQTGCANHPNVRQFDKQTMFDAVDTYLNTGTPITLILPEGKNELVLECTITRRERRAVV